MMASNLPTGTRHVASSYGQVQLRPIATDHYRIVKNHEILGDVFREGKIWRTTCAGDRAHHQRIGAIEAVIKYWGYVR